MTPYFPSPPLFRGTLAATKRLHSYVINGRRVQVLHIYLSYKHGQNYLWSAQTSHGPMRIYLRNGQWVMRRGKEPRVAFPRTGKTRS